jgi:hypothetical protein
MHITESQAKRRELFPSYFKVLSGKPMPQPK